MPSVPGYRAQLTSHIRIPAVYRAGITLYVRHNSSAWKALRDACDLPLKTTSQDAEHWTPAGITASEVDAQKATDQMILEQVSLNQNLSDENWQSHHRCADLLMYMCKYMHVCVRVRIQKENQQIEIFIQFWLVSVDGSMRLILILALHVTVLRAGQVLIKAHVWFCWRSSYRYRYFTGCFYVHMYNF